jgi:hypothetical protein
MQHKKVLEEIAADKKIAKAAEKVEKRRHELSLQKIREGSNASAADICLEEQRKQQAVDRVDCLEEQQKQQVIDMKETERFNDTYFTTGQQQTVVVGDTAVIARTHYLHKMFDFAIPHFSLTFSR